MKEHSVFAGMVMLVVGVIAFQSMQSDAIASPPPPAQTISPLEIMQGARDLPVERIDYPY